MKVVATIAALNLEHGGPPRTVPSLCRCLGEQGAEVQLIAISEGRAAEPLPKDEVFQLTVIPTRASRYRSASWRPAFDQELTAAVTGSKSVIYDVGLWLPMNHFSARIAARTGTPLVISPRGMLSARALQSSKWKKKVAWQLYQRRDLRRACVLHASSESEADDFRHLGLQQPIAVVPNGTEIPPEIGKRGPKGGTRTALFLSRLHPIKGLTDLVNAWARVRPTNWRAVIAGPDENGHRREIELLVSRHGLQDAFEFVGPLSDAQKWELMARSDLFVLPSYSESFGLVIAEALASGLPVVTTRATPWSEIEENRCGWWIAPGVDSLIAAFHQATSRPVEELAAMGNRGRQLVTEKYSWNAAARKMLNLFRWMVEGGERPDCVR